MLLLVVGDIMGSSDGIVIALKSILRSKGIPYGELAEKLGLNETSVKRFMSGHTSLTLERLDQICEIAGVDFSDLAKLAKPQRLHDESQLSLTQEQALADDPHLFLSFYSFIKGLTAEQIVQKYKINKLQLQKSCFQLQKLGLIELFPENRVKVTVEKTIRWQEKGPLAGKYSRLMEADFLGTDFNETDETRSFQTFLLAPKSRKIFVRKIRELLREVQAQSEVDLALEKNLGSTVTVLLALREWSPSLLKEHLR